MNIKFYKKKYLIALYEDDEWLVGLYDNTRDLAKAIEKKLDTTISIISRIFHNKTNKLFIDGKGYDVSFIELTDYDLEILSERGLS